MRVQSQGQVDSSRVNNSQTVDVHSGSVKDGNLTASAEKTNTVQKQELEKAVELVNQGMSMGNYHLEFKLHEGSGRYQVKVINSENQELIREIPPEQVLDFAARVKEMLAEELGIIFDEWA